MTYAAPPAGAARTPDTAWHLVTTVLAVVGILAAALGSWIEFGPDDGTLTLGLGFVDWTWNTADISELWGPMLMIVGGAIAAIPMGIESARDWDSDHHRLLIAAEALVAAIGVAAVVVGIILLF